MSRRMKDSGVEWIGEIPEEWEVSRLRFLGDLSSSGVDKKIYEGESTYKSVHYMDVYNNSLKEIGNSDAYLIISANENKAINCSLQEGDVLFTNSSETPEDIGHSTVINENLENTLYGYHLMRFRPEAEFILHYMKYLFGSFYLRSWFTYRAYGMTRYGINRSDFLDAILFIPPLQEQQFIAEYLDKRCLKLDSLINLQEVMIAQLQAYKQSVITEAVTKGIEPSAPMKESGVEWIGEIPESWQLLKCGNFFEITLGKMLQPEPRNQSDSLEGYLSAINLGNNTLKYEPIKTMWFNETEKKTYRIENGDLMVVEGGDGASSDIVHHLPGELFFQNSLMRVRTKSEDHNLLYLHYWLITAKNKGYINLICNKATIMHFTKSKLTNLPLLFIPSQEELKNIVHYLEMKCAKIDNAISLKQSKIETLKEYKKSLIYECVTGKRDCTGGRQRDDA